VKGAGEDSSVNRERTFIHDDDDDTILFERMREYVIENYPNPERIGCLDHETLAAFVESPGKLDFSDPKYLHIFKCAECTCELNDLRRLREERGFRQQQITGLTSAHGWKGFAVAAAVCLVAVIVVLTWRERSKQVVTNERMEVPVHQLVDLSQDGIPRGLNESAIQPPISLPKRLIELDLVLPFYSPPGDYRITISKARGEGVVLSQLSAAVSHGPRTELHTNLDLRTFRPGEYYLGTHQDGDSVYYYPVRID
jgi:hypothetical protein